jgi:zinc protease
VEADFIYQKETAQGQAQKLGFFHALLGDPEHERAFIAQLARVTPEKIRELARRVLDPTQATLVMVHPRAEAPPATPKELQATLARALAPQTVAPAKRSRAPGRAVERRVLPNGVRLLFHVNPAVPVVALRAAFLGGSRAESAATAGHFHLLADTLTRGTKTRSALDVARAADAFAGHLDGFGGRNSYGVKGEFLSRHLPDALELACDVLLHPSFPEEEVEHSREDALASLKLRDDNPASKAFRSFEAALYGAHPYGRDLLGTPQSLGRATSASLARLHRANASAEGLSLALSGDFDPDAVTEALSRLLRFPKTKTGAIAPPPPPEPREPHTVRLASPHEQSHVVVGFLGVNVSDPARFGLRVLNSALSGQGGRLFRVLRDEQALAYSVTSTCHEGMEPGYLAGYIATAPESAEAAREGLLREITALARTGLDREELEEARRKLAGTYEIHLQENGFVAAQMALDELYGVGPDHFLHYAPRILKTSRAEVIAAAQHFLRAERAICAVVGPGER